MNAQGKRTVGIIGGSGFIGSHATKRFLEQGYDVKASTTDLSKREKYAHLLALDEPGKLQVDAMDLRDEEAIRKFIQGCDIIVHAGTPFQLDVGDPQAELFEPTVKGTRNFLDAASDAAGLERVVFVASVAAWNTSFPLPPPGQDEGHVFSEQDTPYYNDNNHPYARAKFLADQLVRDFIAGNEHPPFEIVSLSPVMVIGKPLSQRQDSTSMGLLHLIKHHIAPNPFVEMLFERDVAWAMVDVRDVAEAIVQAATRRNLHGRNFLLANETFRVSDIARMLNGQPPVAEAGHTYSNALARRELGIDFTPARTTLAAL